MEVDIDVFKKHLSDIKESNRLVNSVVLNQEFLDNAERVSKLNGCLRVLLDKYGNVDNNDVKRLYVPVDIFNGALAELGFKSQIGVLSDKGKDNTKLRNMVSGDITGIRNSMERLDKGFVKIFSKKNSDYSEVRITE